MIIEQKNNFETDTATTTVLDFTWYFQETSRGDKQFNGNDMFCM